LGIPVRLDLTFLLVLPLLAWLIGTDLDKFVLAFDLGIDPAQLTQGFKPYILGFVAALGLFLSILIHELGHALVGRRFNLKIKHITLWVLGGMAEFERIPRRQGTEAVMAIAGPVTSVFLAGMVWLLMRVMAESYGSVHFILAYLLYMNMVLAIFNLIPALPLDGGRVLRSLLAVRISYVKATQIAATLSKVLAVALGLGGILTLNLWLMLIAFFIFIAVSGESRVASHFSVLSTIRIDDLMSREVATVSPSLTVGELIKMRCEQRFLGFPVVDTFDRVVGFVTLQDVRRFTASGQEETTPVEAIMSKDVETIEDGSSALEAFETLRQSGSDVLIVRGLTGDVCGIVGRADLGRAIERVNPLAKNQE